jgi:hypothetical protein
MGTAKMTTTMTVRAWRGGWHNLSLHPCKASLASLSLLSMCPPGQALTRIFSMHGMPSRPGSAGTCAGCSVSSLPGVKTAHACTHHVAHPHPLLLLVKVFACCASVDGGMSHVPCVPLPSFDLRGAVAMVRCKHPDVTEMEVKMWLKELVDLDLVEEEEEDGRWSQVQRGQGGVGEASKGVLSGVQLLFMRNRSATAPHS